MTLKDRLIGLSGDDHRIVKHCDAGSQSVFFLTGLCIPVIFIICWASGFVVFLQLFNSAVSGALMAFFFSWMITNLYRLLLYTFSKNPLPHVNKKYGRFFSRLIRLCFLCFIAAMISKPLESLLYKDLLDRDIAVYKAMIMQSSHNKIVSYHQQQIDEIEQLSEDALYCRQFVQNRRRDCQKTILKADALINSSTFFLQRLRFLCEDHRSCWWITSFFLLVFLYPLALRHQLRNCSYYQLRGSFEQRKVDLNYYAFLKRHAMLFEKFHRRRVAFAERYEDAPYNTNPKQDLRRFLTENEFISELYHV